MRHCCALLTVISAVVALVAGLEGSSPKPINAKQLAAKFLKKYGSHYRVIEANVRLENGTKCTEVRDYVMKTSDGSYEFFRSVYYNGSEHTAMNLKIPDKMYKDYLETKKWEVDKKRRISHCYTPVMAEEMFLSGAVEIRHDAKADILLIGMGAGYFTSHLYVTYPKFNLTSVEIEPELVRVARDWFGFVEDGRQRVIVMDGAKVVKMAAERGHKYDAVILDACTLDLAVAINCPVGAFLTKEFVKNVYIILRKTGAVIINVISLSQDTVQAADQVMRLYMQKFQNCKAKPAPLAPPNIVVTCTKRDRPDGLVELYNAVFSNKTHEKGCLAKDVVEGPFCSAGTKTVTRLHEEGSIKASVSNMCLAIIVHCFIVSVVNYIC